ncbi:MAG: hypothetical protein A3F72_18890 [Bacteroidetes bacterium RIFCSPLOWO2_12_FULL_35_15]|nr:MAG: hypothetical protein A3F72_18890 [Bacteroidetes bacterium RIFCSPLOWO2_12_FULL_35_15]
MKKFFALFCLTFIVTINVSTSANVTAYLTHATFNSPLKGPFLETYLTVMGHSLKFVKNSAGNYQGAVDIAISISQNGEIKSAQKYTLNSPEIADTTKGFPNFIDQQRFTLTNGSYSMELSISDKNATIKKPFITTVPITINFTDERIMISDIQFLESFTKSSVPNALSKSGYDLLPYVSNYYPENINKIKLYAEIYNSKKILGAEQKIILSYFLESFESKTRLSDYSAFSKQTANDVNILLTELNIEALPSGNYNLVIEIRDKDNKLQEEKKSFIQRQNKKNSLSFNDLKSIDVSKTFVREYKSIDTLTEYIRCLYPISGSSELQFAENQLRGKNLELMQQYFYNFWQSRDLDDPQIAWLEYYKEVMKANKQFGSTNIKGYNTDRGRVYLQYGPPNIRGGYENDPTGSLYEIWQYNTLVDKSKIISNPNNKQSNRKFVFYNSDLISRYKLIHSDAIGEIHNTRWDANNQDDNYNNPR